MLKVNQLAGFGVVSGLSTIHPMYRFTDGGPYLYRNSAFSGDADGKTGTFQFWLRLNGGDNTTQTIFYQNSGTFTYRFKIVRTAGNKILVQGRTSGLSVVLQLQSTSSYVVSSGLIHVMGSFSLSAAAGHLYINNVDDSDAGSKITTNSNIDFAFSGPQATIGTNGSSEYLDGCLGGFYLSRTYLDLSNSANRLKFYNSANIDNYPPSSVSLGSDGSTPESAQPLIYLNNGLSGGTNAGSGGNFTVNGVFSAC